MVNHISISLNEMIHTTRRILRNLSWAVLIEKARSKRDEISRRWSFLTLLTNPSGRDLFWATTLLPLQGLGFAMILLPSINKSFCFFFYSKVMKNRKHWDCCSRLLQLRNFSINPNLRLIIFFCNIFGFYDRSLIFFFF